VTRPTRLKAIVNRTGLFYKVKLPLKSAACGSHRFLSPLACLPSRSPGRADRVISPKVAQLNRKGDFLK
jgi:hypothetical protein